jgi:hypothetical protein
MKYTQKLRQAIYNYLRKFLGIDQEFYSTHMELKRQQREIAELRRIIRDRTDVSADIHFRNASYIIAVGTFRGRDYVQVFRMGDGDFKFVVEQLRGMNRHAKIRFIDAPPEFRAVIDREL